MSGTLRPSHRGAKTFLALILPVWLAAAFSSLPAASQDKDIASLLRRIRDEVLGLERYPGEDFNRGEFHLGPGDDDTNKTHAVGILVRGEAESFLTTIQISPLERSAGDPRVFYALPPKTIVCAFPGRDVRIVRSDYPPAELEELLTAVLKAVVDKKNLLKRYDGRPDAGAGRILNSPLTYFSYRSRTRPDATSPLWTRTPTRWLTDSPFPTVKGLPLRSSGRRGPKQPYSRVSQRCSLPSGHWNTATPAVSPSTVLE
jgi:hypothetical protein